MFYVFKVQVNQGIDSVGENPSKAENKNRTGACPWNCPSPALEVHVSDRIISQVNGATGNKTTPKYVIQRLGGAECILEQE